MRGALAIAIGVAVMLPAVAWAKPRVAVVAFEGDKRGEVQDVMAELLDGDYVVTGPKQVSRALDKLGFETEMSEKELKKLANELEAAAIVRGDLSQTGKRKLLHVRLFVNGKKVRGFKVEFASAQSEKFKQQLKDKMVEKLSGEEKPVKKKKEEPAEAATDEEDPMAGKKGKKAKKEEVAAEPSAKADKKAKKVDDEGEEEAKPDEEASEDEDKPKKTTAAVDGENDDDIDNELSDGVEVEPKSTRGANVAAIRVDIGPSFSSRTLTFNSRNYEEAPKPYGNAPVPGARVSGEFFPLALGNPYKLIAGIGFGGEYDQTLKLNLKSTAQPGTEFPVNQKHWSIGLRIRIAFGSKPTSPTLTLHGGYFHHIFKVDRSGLMEGNILDLPDVFYRGYNPGLDVRIPIIKAVALVFGGQALLVTNAGDIQQPYSYGQAKLTAAQGRAGIDIMFNSFFGLRIVGEAAQYGYAFTGNGELANNRDAEPDTIDVGGAADRYIGFAGTLTVLY